MMKRYLGISLLITVIVAAAAACGRAAEPDPNPPIKIVLYPAREPRPALKYQLLPPLLERRPGNAALHYLKVPHEQTQLFADGAFWTTMGNWAEMPLPELRKAAGGEGKQYAWIVNPSGIFDSLERGARCESCDWEIPIREKIPTRSSCPTFRRTANRPGFWRRGRGCRSPTAGTMRPSERCGPVMPLGGTWLRPPRSSTAWLAPPLPVACRNKWRRSSSSPMPPISTGPWPRCRSRWLIFVRALKGKWSGFVGFYVLFPDLRDLDKKSYTAEHWRQLLQQTVDKMTMLTQCVDAPQQQPAYNLAMAASMLEGYPRAKRFLIARGRSPAEVEAMPVPQVILLYTVQNYDEIRDDMFKWLALPYPEARRGLEQVDRKLRDGSGCEIIPLARLLLPALQALKQCEARTDRNLVALEVLEALRIYAADHDGRLPDSLKDITEVPIPLDPLRGEPFVYQRQGNTAILESPFPANPNLRLRYEIQLNREGAKP